MVGTFLNEGGNGFQKIKIMPPKTEPEKVTNTVATFLNKGGNSFQKIRIMTTKTGFKKVASTVATFLKEDSNGLWIISVNKFFNEILKQFQPMNLSKKNHFQQSKEYSEKPDSHILFALISAKRCF